MTTIHKVKCLRCGAQWFPRTPGRPARCANIRCRSPYWDTVKTKLGVSGYFKKGYIKKKPV